MGANQPCLPNSEAIVLVFKCGSPETNGVPTSTTLGVLFGGQRLVAFCQCVANGAGRQLGTIPCGASNTLQDVIDAISC